MPNEYDYIIEHGGVQLVDALVARYRKKLWDQAWEYARRDGSDTVYCKHIEEAAAMVDWTLRYDKQQSPESTNMIGPL